MNIKTYSLLLCTSIIFASISPAQSCTDFTGYYKRVGIKGRIIDLQQNRCQSLIVSTSKEDPTNEVITDGQVAYTQNYLFPVYKMSPDQKVTYKFYENQLLIKHAYYVADREQPSNPPHLQVLKFKLSLDSNKNLYIVISMYEYGKEEELADQIFERSQP